MARQHPAKLHGIQCLGQPRLLLLDFGTQIGIVFLLLHLPKRSDVVALAFECRKALDPVLLRRDLLLDGSSRFRVVPEARLEALGPKVFKASRSAFNVEVTAEGIDAVGEVGHGRAGVNRKLPPARTQGR